MPTFPLIVLMSCSILLAGCTTAIPDKKEMDVPFTPQAPLGNWSEPWQNACEETSIYMVDAFYRQASITQEDAIKRIPEIVEKKNEAFGVREDESMQMVHDLVKTMGLSWTTEVKKDPTQKDLKKELMENRPVIVPVYAPHLHYVEGGPDYHVMVLVGYDDAEGVFIVNDPGSASGKNTRFPYDLFINAIHDLNREDYTAGEKVVLFTHP